MVLRKVPCWLAIVLLAACAEVGSRERSRPNIIVILADDMGYSDLGSYGSEIHTPHLDQLAVEGVRFSQCYNAARCCPSRAALLSGLYPHQAGIGGMTDTDLDIPEYQGFFNDSTVTIAEVLGQAGYTSYMSGKWHLGEEPEHWPEHHGFDRSFAFINGAASFFDFESHRNELWPPGNELAITLDGEKLDFSDSNFYATDLYTDQAIRFLDHHKEPDPFFLYLAYTAPHWPLHALPEDIAKYQGVYDEGWDAIRLRRYHTLKELGLIHEDTRLSTSVDPEHSWANLSKEERKREARLMEVYAAMIDCLDQNIGRLLASLEGNGQLENTAIFFLSDNGGAAAGNLAAGKYANTRFEADALPGTPKSFTGYGKKWANVSNTPFRLYKSRIHQGGIATPMIAWFPSRFEQGVIRHLPVHIVDLMPTITELAGTAYPIAKDGIPTKPTVGQSLLSTLSGGQPPAQRPMYFEHMSHAGLIENDWKLVRQRDKPWELYHLSEDRSETLNLSSQYTDRLDLMIMKYEAWADQNGVLPREEIEKRMKYKF